MFPNEQITEQQSTLFVKKLLAVAVSNITYLRAMFPEQAFGDRSLEGDHVHHSILKIDQHSRVHIPSLFRFFNVMSFYIFSHYLHNTC